MFGYYSIPSSHFGQYYPSSSSRSIHYYPSPSSSPSSFRNSCSAQYHRHPSASRQAYYLDDDDNEEAASSSASYYEYLDAARREQERRELLEAQARRRVQEERALQYARAEAQLRAAAARAQQEQERQREREYREYVERQLEARREAQLGRALQIQREREQQAQHEEEQLRLRKIRQLHLQQQERQRERLLHQRAQHEKQSQSSASFDGQDLARAIFGQLGWSPVTPSHQYQQHEQQQAQQDARSPSSVPAQPAVQPIKSVPSHSQPAVKPLPPSAPASSPTGPAQPKKQQQQATKMSYTTAVNLIQGLAKEQIDLRQRLRALHSLREQFSSLKSSFVPPQSYVISSLFLLSLIKTYLYTFLNRLIFDTTSKSATVETPVLAYTTQNRPLQAYEEALTRILTQLDAIPSQGSERIKVARKEIARDVQAELDALDREKIEQWKKLQTGEVDAAEDEAVPGIVAGEEAEVTHGGVATSADHREEQEMVGEAVTAQDEKSAGDTILVMPPEKTEKVSSQGERAKERNNTSNEADEPVVQMDTDTEPIFGTAELDSDTTQHVEAPTYSPDSASTPAGLDPSQDASTSSNHSPTASGSEEATPTALPPSSSGEVTSPSAEPVPLPQPDTTIPSTEMEQAPECPSIPDSTADPSSAPSHTSAAGPTSSDPPERQDSTPSGAGSSSSRSVSATLLPTSLGGLGLIEVLSPGSRAEEDHHDDNDRGSDTESDTSFEML